MGEKLGSQATGGIGFPSAYRKSCGQSRISHKLGKPRYQIHGRDWGAGSLHNPGVQKKILSENLEVVSILNEFNDPRDDEIKELTL